ncbi:hypothetical protein CPB83DRAFT_691922 [Crepidotus variabilis]|uniref:Uncharacterized protein n=1 Tax=Crepidotus variabilis TaxID=179855 RepID=A0A9P6JK09_9AGAR|nr:hypothetical protein CPB83DRAFT_691922 [Crepidotus variabilis]
MSSKSTIVDDRDANGKFTGQWRQDGVAEENNHSTTYTKVKGAQAQFTFTGTKIGIYGTIASKKQPEQKHNPESTYKVDDGPEIKFTGKLGENVAFKQLFFQSDDLSAGKHTLTITNQVDDGFLYIDYLEIQPVATTSSSFLPSSSLRSSSSAVSASTTAQQASTVISHATITTVVDYTPSPSADSSVDGADAVGTTATGTNNATKIAAGIFGGIVGVAFLVAIIVVALKKRKDKRRDEAIDFYANRSPWHQKTEYQ